MAFTDVDAAKVGTLTLTAQAASIGATAFITAPTAGLYRISINGEITQAATTSSSLIVTIGYTNGAAVTSASNAVTANTVGADTSGVGQQSKVIRVASGNITYATTYASSGATPMQYRLDLVAEQLT